MSDDTKGWLLLLLAAFSAPFILMWLAAKLDRAIDRANGLRPWRDGDDW